MIYSVAIDGPAASGKSSTAKEVAKQLGFQRIDSGLFYRAITYLLIEAFGIENMTTEFLQDERVKKFVDGLAITQSESRIYYCAGVAPGITSNSVTTSGITSNSVTTSGITSNVTTLTTPSNVTTLTTPSNVTTLTRDITHMLRSPAIDTQVGTVAKELYVRQKVLSIQKDSLQNENVVMDGRDIGTVVMTEAFLKVFIIATETTRAMRRSKETGQDYEEVLRDLKRRDFNDMNRQHGPLKQAEDAFVIENDRMTKKETVDEIVRLFNEKLKNKLNKRGL